MQISGNMICVIGSKYDCEAIWLDCLAAFTNISLFKASDLSVPRVLCSPVKQKDAFNATSLRVPNNKVDLQGQVQLVINYVLGGTLFAPGNFYDRFPVSGSARVFGEHGSLSHWSGKFRFTSVPIK